MGLDDKLRVSGLVKREEMPKDSRSSLASFPSLLLLLCHDIASAVL